MERFKLFLKINVYKSQQNKKIQIEERLAARNMLDAIIIIMRIVKKKSKVRKENNFYSIFDLYRVSSNYTLKQAKTDCKEVFQKYFHKVFEKQHTQSLNYVDELLKRHFEQSAVNKMKKDFSLKNGNVCWFIKKLYKKKMKSFEGKKEIKRLYPKEFMYFICLEMIDKLKQLRMQQEVETLVKEMAELYPFYLEVFKENKNKKKRKNDSSDEDEKSDIIESSESEDEKSNIIENSESKLEDKDTISIIYHNQYGNMNKIYKNQYCNMNKKESFDELIEDVDCEEDEEKYLNERYDTTAIKDVLHYKNPFTVRKQPKVINRYMQPRRQANNDFNSKSKSADKNTVGKKQIIQIVYPFTVRKQPNTNIDRKNIVTKVDKIETNVVERRPYNEFQQIPIINRGHHQIQRSSTVREFTNIIDLLNSEENKHNEMPKKMTMNVDKQTEIFIPRTINNTARKPVIRPGKAATVLKDGREKNTFNKNFNKQSKSIDAKKANDNKYSRRKILLGTNLANKQSKSIDNKKLGVYQKKIVKRFVKK